MTITLLTAGIACVMAAIVGGGLRAFDVEIPALTSGKRQAALALFGIALLGAAYWTSDSAKMTARSETKPTAASPVPKIPAEALELVDVSFADEERANEWSTCPVLDIKLVNNSLKTVVIKKIEFHIKKTWRIPSLHIAAMMLPASAAYDVEIPGETTTPLILEKKISHVLAANEADRFEFVFFQAMKPYDNPDIAYLMNVLVIYDADDKSISSGDLLFAVHQALNTYRASDTSGKWHPDGLRSCKQMASEIERLPYPKSRMLKALLEAISEAG